MKKVFLKKIIDRRKYVTYCVGVMNILAIRFDNTKSIKDKCASGEYTIPGIHSGNERYRFEVGERVTSSGLGTIIAGEDGTVVSREMNNGYCRYYVKFDCGTKSNQRQKDLVKKSI